MKILLDTNFIVTCIKEKIDFLSQIKDYFGEDVEFIIPEEIINELSELSLRKGEKEINKNSAKIGLSLIETFEYKTLKLNNNNVDQGIIDYIKNKDINLATIDKKLASRVSNNVISLSKSRKGIISSIKT